MTIAPLAVLSTRASAAWWFKSEVRKGGIKTYRGEADARYVMGDNALRLLTGDQPLWSPLNGRTLTRDQLLKDLYPEGTPQDSTTVRTHRTKPEIKDALDRFDCGDIPMIFCKVQTLDGVVKFVGPLMSIVPY